VPLKTKRSATQRRVALILSLFLAYGLGLATPQTQWGSQESKSPAATKTPMEEQRFEELYAGYHEALTSLSSKSINEAVFSGDLSRKKFSEILGVPKACDTQVTQSGNLGSPSLTVINEQVTEGKLFLVEGAVVCKSLVLPWNALVGIPLDKSPKGILVLVHGTGSSPEQLFGISTGDYSPDYSGEAGIKALRDGFVVVAPRVLTDLRLNESGYNLLRGRVDRRAQTLGIRLIGMEQAALSGLIANVTEKFYLDKLPKFIYGVSLGGLTAFYQAALNPEIDGVIVSQWIEERSEKQAGADYEWADWRFETGDYAMLKGSAFELKDERVATLIYPRPLGIEVGSLDPRAEAMLPVVKELRRLYRDTPENLVIQVVDGGGHQMFYNPVVANFWDAMTIHHLNR